jgi:hypothetical protein
MASGAGALRAAQRLLCFHGLPAPSSPWEDRQPIPLAMHKQSRIVEATTAWLVAGALLAFVLAYASPVERVDADAAVALLASQSLVERGSLRLDPYLGRPGLAYNLDTDYRVRRYQGAYYPNSLGVPIVSAPFVWVANRFGFDMLDQHAEFALQNLLSAVSCAVLFVLLFRLCLLFVGAGASVAIAGVSTFGTSVMSTGGTALWNSDYSLVFCALALLHLARRHVVPGARLNLSYLAVLVAAAFLCRPLSAPFALACLGYLLFEEDRRVAIGAEVLLVLVSLAVAFPRVVPLPWMTGHYSPGRLRYVNAPGFGAYAILLSPSRGLLVFSPFIVLTIAGAARYLRALRRDRLYWLCVVWVVVHTVFVAVDSGRWWGGHAFGPRLMVDLIPALVLLTCLVWRAIGLQGSALVRRVAVGTFAVLGAVSMAIHSGQGLFNPATHRWNLQPDIDRNPNLALAWRYPQFLASDGMLQARWNELERQDVEARRLTVPAMSLVAPIPFDSTKVVFVHWYEPEAGWRWTRGDVASVLVRLGRVDASRLHLVEVVAGALGRQHVRVAVNGVLSGEFELDGFAPVRQVVAVPGSGLRSGVVNDIELRVSNPSRPPGDVRWLGVALRQLRLLPMPETLSLVTYADDVFFGEGFSDAEAGWRWTNAPRAVVHYPAGQIDPAAEYALELRAGAYGHQRVDMTLNGTLVGHAGITGLEPVAVRSRFSGALLRPHAINRIELLVPDAAPAPGDPRRLGLSLVQIRIVPLAAAAGAARRSGSTGDAGRGGR